MCVCVCLSVCVCMQPVMSIVLIHYVLWSGCLPVVVCMYLGSADFLCVFNGPHQSFHCVLEITHSCGLIGLSWDTFVLAVVWCI